MLDACWVGPQPSQPRFLIAFGATIALNELIEAAPADPIPLAST